jgi:circadian clock protein KaiB
MAERMVAKGKDKEWNLVIYIAGQTPTMKNAIANLREICEHEMQGRYHIEVVDLKKHPERASKDQILAIPTVVRELPPPIKDLLETSR